MAYNYLDKTGLTKLWAKIKDKFVVKDTRRVPIQNTRSCRITT